MFNINFGLWRMRKPFNREIVTPKKMVLLLNAISWNHKKKYLKSRPLCQRKHTTHSFLVKTKSSVPLEIIVWNWLHLGMLQI